MIRRRYNADSRTQVHVTHNVEMWKALAKSPESLLLILKSPAMSV